MNCAICFETTSNIPEDKIYDCTYCPKDNIVCINCQERINTNVCPICKNTNWRRQFNKIVCELELLKLLKELKSCNLIKHKNMPLVLSGFTYFGLNQKFNNMKVKLDEDSKTKLDEYINSLELPFGIYIPLDDDLLTIKVKPFSIFFDKNGNQVETIKPKHNVKFIVTFTDVWTRNENSNEAHEVQGISCILQECKMENRVMSEYLA